MRLGIKGKLLAVLFGVIALFLVVGVTTIFKVRLAGEHTGEFIAEHWPTADLIMEARIALGEASREVMGAASEDEPDALVAALQARIAALQSDFHDKALEPAVVDRVAAGLERVGVSLEVPVIQARFPLAQMERAHAAASLLTDEARALEDLELINALWDAVTTFNDFLIDGDAREREHFATEISSIENHPAFPAIAERFEIFRTESLAVFTAAEELRVARERFHADVGNIAAELQRLEESYVGGVVRPAAEAVLSELNGVPRIIGAGLLGGVLISLLGGWLLARNIGNPARAVVDMCRHMAEGRLGGAMASRRRDELGMMAQAMNELSGKFSDMVLRIKHSTATLGEVSRGVSGASDAAGEAAHQQVKGVEAVSLAVERIKESGQRVSESAQTLNHSAAESSSSVLEMSASIDEVALNAERLAASVEEVSTSIEEMAASIAQVAEGSQSLKESSESTASSVAQMDIAIKQVEENAASTLEITRSVRRDAESGQASVEATITGMREIGVASQVAAEVIASLSEKARDIGVILSVIEEVTDQTNLLALNASIIAAQAGEHGKGFSVVAEEIRELALRSGNSAQEIAEVVKGIQGESERAVAAIRQAESRVAEGEGLSRKSGEALAQIVEGIQGVAEQMDRIAAATREQAGGSRMIRASVEQVLQMTGQIATATSEQEKAGRMITESSATMRELTAQVRNSTREQSRSGKIIAEVSEKISALAATIDTACDEQNRQSDQIVAAVDGIHGAAQVNLSHSDTLQGAVSALSEQLAVLESEIRFFEVVGEDTLQPA